MRLKCAGVAALALYTALALLVTFGASATGLQQGISERNSASGSDAADLEVPEICGLREQAEVRDAWLAQRLDTVVPMLMRREGIDMWILIARDYNEDPVVETMLPATWLSARRRTVLMFFDSGYGKAVENLSASPYAPGQKFTAASVPESQPDQWARIADEMLAYPTIVRIAHAIIAEGLSERVVTHGITTTAEDSWWYRERIGSTYFSRQPGPGHTDAELSQWDFG